MRETSASHLNSQLTKQYTNTFQSKPRATVLIHGRDLCSCVLEKEQENSCMGKKKKARALFKSLIQGMEIVSVNSVLPEAYHF